MTNPERKGLLWISDRWIFHRCLLFQKILAIFFQALIILKKIRLRRALSEQECVSASFFSTGAPSQSPAGVYDCLRAPRRKAKSDCDYGLGAPPPNRTFVHAYKRPVEMHKIQNACKSPLSNLIH